MTDPEPTGTPETDNAAEAPGLSSEDQTLAMLAHILGIFTSFIGALVIWLVKKDSSEFTADQAKEALNFQITMFIAAAIAALTMIIGIGCILLPAVSILNLVFCIIAGVAAAQGQRYRYPICLRLVP